MQEGPGSAIGRQQLLGVPLLADHRAGQLEFLSLQNSLPNTLEGKQTGSQFLCCCWEGPRVFRDYYTCHFFSPVRAYVRLLRLGFPISRPIDESDKRLFLVTVGSH